MATVEIESESGTGTATESESESESEIVLEIVSVVGGVRPRGQDPDQGQVNSESDREQTRKKRSVDGRGREWNGKGGGRS